MRSFVLGTTKLPKPQRQDYRNIYGNLVYSSSRSFVFVVWYFLIRYGLAEMRCLSTNNSKLSQSWPSSLHSIASLSLIANICISQPIGPKGLVYQLYLNFVMGLIKIFTKRPKRLCLPAHFYFC